MNAPAQHLPPAVADYLSRNPETAIRIANMRQEDAAAAVQRIERWIDAQSQSAPEQAQSVFSSNLLEGIE